jgi:O-antigen/teichoic acid export membrane protein
MKIASTIDRIEIPPREDSLAAYVGGNLLARNSFLNLITQVIPLLLGVAAIPFLVSHLGTARFGLLSLWWVLLGNTSVVDLGLGRATTMFVADAIAVGDRARLAKVVWTSVILQTLVGMAAGVLVAEGVPILLHHLKVPPDLLREGRVSFMIFAAILAVDVPKASLRGALEAMQRFDLVSLVKAPLNSSMFLLPVFMIMKHGGLVGVALSLSAAVLTAGIAYLVLCLYVIPELRHFSLPTWRVVTSLARYGGWVSVSNFVGPIITYVDRFMIGSFLNLSAVAYYTAPYDAVTRLWILPSSISTTLFPAFTTLRGENFQDRRSTIYMRSLKYLLLCIGPLVLVMAVYSRDILHIWLGLAFADKSSLVLQFLACAVLVNSLAWVPFSLLQAQGRPDLTAKFHLLELLVQVGLLWGLVITLGVVGAALACMLRVLLDAALMFGTCERLRFVTIESKDKFVLLTLLSLVGFAIVLSDLGVSRSMIVLVGVALFFVLTWCFLLNSADRGWLIWKVRAAWLLPRRMTS